MEEKIQKLGITMRKFVLIAILIQGNSKIYVVTRGTEQCAVRMLVLA